MPGVFFCLHLPQMPTMSIEDRGREIGDDFAFLDDWEARYAHIIDLGKANPPLQDHERTEQTRVRGCASQVWMVLDELPDGAVSVRAESDAMIVSGLIALLIKLYSGAQRSEIAEFDAKGFLDRIGVTGALSAQRSNGLASMIQRIHAFTSEPTAQAE